MISNIIIKRFISVGILAIFTLCFTALDAGEPTTIILTRHGRTHWNDQKLWQGTKDSRLNQTGVKQALEKMKDYEDLSVDAVYSSPRKRAYLTAQIIATAHDLDVIKMEGLSEPWLGELEGMYNDDAQAMIDPILNGMNREERLNSGQLPGLMSANRVAAKTEEALMEICRSYPGGTVIAIAHSGNINSIVAIHTEAILDTIGMTNMSYLKFKFDGENLELIEISSDITYSTYQGVLMEPATKEATPNILQQLSQAFKCLYSCLIGT